MFSTLLSLSALLPVPALTPGSAPVELVSRVDDEFDRRLEEAGKDVEKLWELYLWCESSERNKEARKVALKVIREEPDHEEARAALGHQYFDGQWFKTQKKLDAYKKKEEKRIAKEKGLVRYKDEWVPKEDVEFLEKGMMRDEDGKWVSAEEYKRISEGWVRHDLEWIHPDELPNVEKGLFKCGSEWLSEEDANEYHKSLNRWWKIPSDHFVLWGTLDRKVMLQVMDEMERASRDMARIYGQFPAEPVNVMMLRDADQYGAFAAGSDSDQHPATEVRGLSSIHYAFFADAYFSQDEGFIGMGAGYWDASTENGPKFGVHSCRAALGFSLADAMDPSPKAIERVLKTGNITESYINAYFDEKRIPAWFSTGAAVYLERYYEDNLVAKGGNQWWPREWSISNIANKGGMDSLGQIFDLELNAGDPSTGKLMNEAGLLMAFMIDSDCAPVKTKHAELKQKLKAGEDVKGVVRELQKLLEKHEKDLLKFAGL